MNNLYNIYEISPNHYKVNNAEDQSDITYFQCKHKQPFTWVYSVEGDEKVYVVTNEQLKNDLDNYVRKQKLEKLLS